jgi:hypothetical protein
MEIKENTVLAAKHKHLTYASSHASTSGVILEFGVASGASINLLSTLHPNQLCIGFDSWSGLPEDWDRGDCIVPAGTFACKVPTFNKPNIVLCKGDFSNTAPVVAKHLQQNASLIHIDCDLYSSAVSALNSVTSLVTVGTIIVFDEYENYARTQHKSTNYQNEQRAFSEWCSTNNIKATQISRTNFYQAAFRIDCVLP